MDRGLYIGAAGALVAEAQADNVANNLANVSTGGFKRTLLQVSSTPSLDLYRIQTDPGVNPDTGLQGKPVSQYVGPLGLGAVVEDTPTQFEQGSLETTGNPFNFALAGNGFFTIQTPQGQRYTRDGSFIRNAQNLLTTKDGNLVLGQNGAITLPDGKPGVDAKGNIGVNGNVVDQLRITEFNNLGAVRKEGDSNFTAAANAGARDPAQVTTSVIQGALEKSNANVVQSMVQLIVAERTFDANQKVIQTEDDATNMAITQVGHNQ